MPAGLGARPSLLVFFHGDTWIPEVAAKSNRTAAISVLAGEGSGVYTKLFEDPQRFLRHLLVTERRGLAQAHDAGDIQCTRAHPAFVATPIHLSD